MWRRRDGKAGGRWSAAIKSLTNYNYRLYFFGQCVSITGTWMQRVSQGLLVLDLTGSGRTLGLVSGVQSLPYLLIGTWGGVLADRADKRRLLILTQGTAGLLALVMSVLVASDMIQVWMVFVLSFSLGMVNALDNPGRQSFVSEMVGRDHVTNAVTLNSIATNVGKSLGPAVAGVLISLAGLAAAFLFNAISYLAVVTALLVMRRHELQRAERAPKSRGQIREGLIHVRSTPVLWVPLFLLLVTGMLAADWQVRLPLLAIDTFHGDAKTYGWMLSSVGIGAIIGGFAVAGLLSPTKRALLVTASTFSIVLLFIAASPLLWVSLTAMFLLGATNIAFTATAQSILQLEAAPHMRGRVMSLSSIVQRGTSPASAPLAGVVAEGLGPRFSLALGGCATLAATFLGASALRGKVRRAGADQPIPPAALDPEIDT